MPEWVEIVVSILSGLAVTIPLIVKLVEYIVKATKEKNWQALLQLVTNLMAEAESKFDNGNERREWVLMCVKASADTIQYEIDMEVVDKLITDLCALSKQVNAPVAEVAPEEVTE